MAVDQSAYEAAKNGKPKKDGNSGGDRGGDRNDFSTLLDVDVTADYQAGQELVDRRLKAFGKGVQDRLKEVQGVMRGFTGGQFIMNKATYQRPTLPPSPKETQKSVLSLLFGSDLEVEEDGQG